MMTLLPVGDIDLATVSDVTRGLNWLLVNRAAPECRHHWLQLWEDNSRLAASHRWGSEVRYAHIHGHYNHRDVDLTRLWIRARVWCLNCNGELWVVGDGEVNE